jgi:hypothetical protein
LAMNPPGFSWAQANSRLDPARATIDCVML